MDNFGPPPPPTAGAADTRRAVLFGVLTAGATNNAQAGLNLGHSGSASGPSKAVAGAARQTVLSQASRQRDNRRRENETTRPELELFTPGGRATAGPSGNHVS